ncbi:MAG: DNA-processing protein DprA, partial [Bacteroidota bacterium]
MDRVLPIESPDYPARLRDLANPPDPLFVRGAWDHEGPVVAIVGARSALGDGLEMARRLAADLAREGAAVVSGLARGIDAAAHEGALEAGGRTGAVIGTPLDLVYPPAHRELQGRVARSLGLMSELPPGAHPTRSTFVSRNRMLAAIADLVVLVQGDLESGALRTVEAAERLGRPVGAVPWHAEEPLAAAPHALIHDRRAVLVRDAADVLELAGEPRSPLLATARAAAAG